MRYLLSILFLCNYAFALISTPLHSQLVLVDEDEEIVHIKPINGVQVGMFGIVQKSFEGNHAMALNWVQVIEITNEYISAQLIPIEILDQSALPTGIWTPKVGDEVVLGYNYHRALLISPNPRAYKKVTTFHKNRYWVHPDIFATVISTNGHPTPLIEDFQETCKANDIGLLYFLFDESIITVDCRSFIIMENKSVTLPTSEAQLPFYSRLSTIDANWFGEGSDELLEYSPYYVTLLAENNPDNEWIQAYQEKKEDEEPGFWSWLSGSDESTESLEDRN